MSLRDSKFTDKFSKSVSCVCWAYNEESLIEDFILKIYQLLSSSIEEFEILVIDDCSTDNTNHIITQMQKSIPQITLLKNETNRNVGYSCKRAIREAKCEYLFWQTVDWSYDISDLRLYLEYLKTYDVVVGSRRAPIRSGLPLSKIPVSIWFFFGKHLAKRSDTIGKGVVSLGNYFLIRTLFQFPLSDYQNVIFFKSPLVQSITIESDSSFVAPELLLKAWWRGAALKEVKISFIPRKLGVAKGTRLKAIRNSVRDILKYWFKWVVLNKRGKVTFGTISRISTEDFE